MAPRRNLTAFEKTIPDYRKRILLSLAKAIVLPPLLSSLVLCLVCRSASKWLCLPLAFLSIPIFIALRSQYTLWAQDREAARLGAQPITRVCGRWPGNLDIVLRLLKAFESGYVLQGFADLFAEYGCTTLNTRFFWDDQVRTRPPAHLFSHHESPPAHNIELDHLHGRQVIPVRGTHRVRPLRKRHLVARADVRL
jgi:hypothetical protein